MFRLKIINKIIKFRPKNKAPESFGQYLKNEDKRNKGKRLKVIENWYNFIHDKTNKKN